MNNTAEDLFSQAAQTVFERGGIGSLISQNREAARAESAQMAILLGEEGQRFIELLEGLAARGIGFGVSSPQFSNSHGNAAQIKLHFCDGDIETVGLANNCGFNKMIECSSSLVFPNAEIISEGGGSVIIETQPGWEKAFAAKIMEVAIEKYGPEKLLQRMTAITPEGSTG